jgi:hypothetical protein
VLLLLLLTLSRGSLVNLLRQSEGGLQSSRLQFLDTISSQGLHLVLQSSGRVSRQSVNGAQTQLSLLSSQRMELAQALLASLLVKGVIGIGLVEIILLLLQLSAVLKHRRHLLGVEEAIRLARRERASGTERKWILATDVQPVKKGRELILATKLGSKHSGENIRQTALSERSGGIEETGHALGLLLSLNGSLNGGGLVSSGRGDATEAGLAMETVGTGLMLELGLQGRGSARNLHLLHDCLLLGKMLFLPGHEILLLLLPSLEGILLLRGQGSTKAGEAAGERRLSRTLVRILPLAGCRLGAMGDANLRHKEGLA